MDLFAQIVKEKEKDLKLAIYLDASMIIDESANNSNSIQSKDQIKLNKYPGNISQSLKY